MGVVRVRSVDGACAMRRNAGRFCVAMAVMAGVRVQVMLARG